MAMNPLPPQAYTKDTLLRAYAWLQNQNASIRGMATTPDILVSLYLKTTRDGEEALDRPSIQNFKNELKSLAGLMGELEIGQSRPSSGQAPKVKSPSAEELATQAYLAASASTSISEFNSNFIPPASTSPPPQPSPSAKATSISRSSGSASISGSSLATGLDTLSVQMLDEIKNGFNLSDQSEALRMLIKLGYEKAKKILIE